MKYGQCREAYTTLSKLFKMDFKAKDAFALFKLYKELECVFQFGLQRERSLIQKYNGEVSADGCINFIHGDDEESRKTGIENLKQFKAELEDLNNMEIDESIHAITIDSDAFGDQKISPADIMSLDGFVAFE